MFVARLGQLPLDAQTRQVVSSLEASVHSMQDLLDGLLDVSRLDAGAVQVHRVAAPVDELFQRDLGLPSSQFSLEMVDDALRDGHRLIGMIQPDISHSRDEARPELFRVGCVGRITQLAESGDGRYILELTGIARFKVVEELTTLTAYRQCKVDFFSFVDDFTARKGEEAVRHVVNDGARVVREEHGALPIPLTSTAPSSSSGRT